MLALGVDPWVLIFGKWNRKSPSHTKRGPGRRHQQGKKETQA